MSTLLQNAERGVRSAERRTRSEPPYVGCYDAQEVPEQRWFLPSLSEAARARMLSLPGEPLFIADWQRVLMIHYEVDAKALQAVVPFELDRHEGRAFVSLVAFTMRGMRPRFGGRLSAWLLKPISKHGFLNVRTYVRHGSEAGIYFMAEWLSNRLSVALGPAFFGLPYHLGSIEYEHSLDGSSRGDEALTNLEMPAAAKAGASTISGRVQDSAGNGVLCYRAKVNSNAGFRECDHGTLTEWLMERFTAFTHTGGKARLFRVWHPPWPQASGNVIVTDQSLLERHWPLFHEASLVGANFSPGVKDVWMGRPHRLVHGVASSSA